MKRGNRFLRRAAFLLAAVIAAAAMPAALPAFADGGEVTAVSYNRYEAAVYGEPAAFYADVTRGGSTALERIKYDDFNVGEFNKLYNNFYAEGRIDGWDGKIEQYIFVVPADLEYLINCGANVTSEIYSYGGEGELGFELDPTGASCADEPYWQAVTRLFPALRNKTAVKQSGVNPDPAGDWGYTGDRQVGSLKMSAAAKNVFQYLMFPKRGTTWCEVSMSLPDGVYDLDIGTYSLWFARAVEVSVNGAVTDAEYDILPTFSVLTKKGVSPSGGKITVKLDGPAMFDEAMVSFVAARAADTAEYPALPAPTADAVMALDGDTLDIGGLQAGAKVQVYNYDTGHLIRETAAEGETAAVTFDESELAGLYRIGVQQMNRGGASPAAIVQRTDIYGLRADYSTAYTGKDLDVRVSASAASSIRSMTVYKDGETEGVYDFPDGGADFNYTFAARGNGEYRVRLESGSGAVSVTDFTVSNIDKGRPALTVGMTLNGAKNSGRDKFTLELAYAGVSPAASLTLGGNGTESALAPDAKTLEIAESGDYTLTLSNAVGRRDAKRFFAAFDEADLKTVALSRSEVKKTLRHIEIELRPVNNYAFKSASVYFDGGGSGAAERMLVNGNKFNAYANGLYFVQAESADGTLEIFTVSVSNIVFSQKEAAGGGLSEGAAAAIAAGGAAVLVGAGAFAVIKITPRKKTRP
jgi:hypothetical protein